VGEHAVTVQISHEVSAPVRVIIETEGGEPETSEESDAAETE
jgi:hypothetical protein